MEFKKDTLALTLGIVLGVGVSAAHANDWTRGCGVRNMPQGQYQDLRYATPPEYVSPERYVPWDSEKWAEPAARFRRSEYRPDAGYERQYRNNPYTYGQQNYYEPYAKYEPYTGHKQVRYGRRRAYTNEEHYPYQRAEYTPQYPDDNRFGNPGQVYHARRDDDRYESKYEYGDTPDYRSYPQETSALIKKEAIYPYDRVYTSPQSTIVGNSSSAPYKVNSRGKGVTGVILPGPDSVYSRRGRDVSGVEGFSRYERQPGLNQENNKASVSNAYFSRQGVYVDNTQKMPALPAQGRK